MKSGLTKFAILLGVQFWINYPAWSAPTGDQNSDVHSSTSEFDKYEDENITLKFSHLSDGSTIFHITPHHPEGRPLRGARECTLEILKKDTPLYHWTDSRIAGILSQKGQKTDEDIRTCGAHYMSEDILDSMGFGSHLLISRPSADLYLIRPEKCRPGSSEGERIFEEFWKNAKEEAKTWMRHHGLVGSYSDSKTERTWMSVIDSRATILKAATDVDLYSDWGLGKSRIKLDLATWIRLDSRYPIPNNEWLQKQAPAVYKMISSHPLTAEEEASAHDLIIQLLGENKERSPYKAAEFRSRFIKFKLARSKLYDHLRAKFSVEIEQAKKDADTVIAEAKNRGDRNFLNENGVDMFADNFKYD